MKKRMILVLMAALTALLFLYGSAYAQAPTSQISNETQLLTLFYTGGSGMLTSNVKLSNNALQVGTGKVVDLDLNSFQLDMNGNTILVPNGATLNLYDLSVDTTPGSIINNTYVKDNNGVAFVLGNFNMYGGVISNSQVKFFGGAVTIGGGTFTMYDGAKITNCTAGSGGAVAVLEGSFVMEGGTIESCSASTMHNGQGFGGAVYLEFDSTFTMKDGEIKNCTAEHSGGAVYCPVSSFHMYGGSITGNISDAGGGVYNGENPESFHMHGGTISGNKAVYYGGGVFNEGDCSFDGKCIVKDNFSYDGDDTMAEANKIKDDVCTSVKLTIGNEKGTDDVAAGSEIWVRGFEIDDIFTDDAKPNDAQYFFSDTDYVMAEYDAGEEELVFVSRITQDPDPEINNNTVGVDMTGLTYSAPKYQWILLGTGSAELKDSVIPVVFYGEIASGTNTVTATKRTLWNDPYYAIDFALPYETETVTFTSNGTGLTAYSNTLESSGNNYTYTIIESSQLFSIYSENPFTIENVTFNGTVMEQKINDTDATLTGGVPGEAYFCYLFYQDGSYDFTYVTTVLDTPTPTPTNVPTPVPSSAPTSAPTAVPTVPKTGDSMPFGLLCALAVMTLAGITLLARKRLNR